MKRSQIKRYPLADSVIKALEPESGDYMVKDSPGLYLRVKSTGTKSWIVRYKHPKTKKWAWKGIGGYPTVGAKHAREGATQLLQRVSAGESINQTTVKYTVGMSIDRYQELKIAQERSPNTLRSLKNLCENHIRPQFGDRVLDEVTRLELNGFIKQLESAGQMSSALGAQKLLKQLYSFSMASGYCQTNPASELHRISTGYTAVSHPYLKESELPKFLKEFYSSNMNPVFKNAIETLMLTASRPAMILDMEWSEIELEQALWTIPSSKMKMNVEHQIPLSNQTVNQLTLLKSQGSVITNIDNDYVFKPTRKTKKGKLGNGTLNRALIDLGYRNKIVPHGFRHTASTLLREHGWDKSLVESQLAHKESGIAGVYNKAKYLEKRREMMNWYADYLNKLKMS